MQHNNFLRKSFSFDWKGALVLFLGGMVPLFALSLLNVLGMMVFGRNFQYDSLYLILTNLVMWLGAIVAFDYFICRPQTGKKLSFNFSTKNFFTYVLIFPLMLGMMLIAEFITLQIPTTGPFFGPLYEWFSDMMQMLTSDTLTMIILAVVMAPIFEELVFRGIIQKGLINKGVRPLSAIWISAVIFGLVHGNPWQFVGAVLLGYVLGLVYYKTRSILMPILLHAFNNGISVLLITYGGTESFAEFFGLSPFLLLAAGLIIFGLFYYLFTNKFEIHHSE